MGEESDSTSEGITCSTPHHGAVNTQGKSVTKYLLRRRASRTLYACFFALDRGYGGGVYGITTVFSSTRGSRRHPPGDANPVTCLCGSEGQYCGCTAPGRERCSNCYPGR